MIISCQSVFTQKWKGVKVGQTLKSENLKIS